MQRFIYFTMNTELDHSRKNGLNYWESQYLASLEGFETYLQLDVDKYKRGANMDTIPILFDGKPLRLDTGKVTLVGRPYNPEFNKVRLCIPKVANRELLTRSDDGSYTLNEGVELTDENTSSIYTVCRRIDQWLQGEIDKLKKAKTIGSRTSKAKIQYRGKSELYKLSNDNFVNLKIGARNGAVELQPFMVDGRDYAGNLVDVENMNSLVKSGATARVFISLPNVMIHQAGLSISSFVNALNVKNPVAKDTEVNIPDMSF